jgi:hypothetical protein
MKVKFVKEVVSAIGTFVVGQVHTIEDEHVLSNWIEMGLIEPLKEKVKAEKAPKEVADINEDK